MKEIYSRIKYIGYYQIIGGIIGILMILVNNFKSSYSNGFYLFVLFLSFTLFSLSVYSGFLLLRKKHLIGLKVSLFTQAIQILSFVLFGYIFDFVIGLYFRITVELTNDTIVGLDFGFFKGIFSRTANPDIIEFNLNLIAIILLFIISRYYDRIKNELTKKSLTE